MTRTNETMRCQIVSKTKVGPADETNARGAICIEPIGIVYYHLGGVCCTSRFQSWPFHCRSQIQTRQRGGTESSDRTRQTSYEECQQRWNIPFGLFSMTIDGNECGSSNRIMGGWWLSLLTAVVTVSGALQRVQLKTNATIRTEISAGPIRVHVGIPNK